MKKFFAVILALAMTFALSATALAENSPADTYGPANLHDCSGTIPDNQIAANYTVTVDGENLTISADYVQMHTNGAGWTGRWIGFYVIPGDVTAKAFKQKIGNATEWSGPHSLQPNVDGQGHNGFVHWFDADDILETPISVSFQWFTSDAEGATAVGEAHTYKVKYEQNKGTITIINAAIGKKYCIRKIFDATYSADGVSYTYTKKDGNDTAYEALVSDGSPFKLTQIGATNTYQVETKEGKSAVDISSWLKTNKELFTPETCKTAETNTVFFGDLDFGYYYIETDNGANVTVDTAAPNAVVIDKNGAPGFEGGGKTIVDENGNVIETPSANIGDTIHFKIEANVPKFNGDKPVITYKFVDSMGVGLDYAGNVKVVLHNDAATPAKMDITGQCTITPTTTGGQSLTIEFHPNSDATSNPPVTGIENYYPNAHVVITYDAIVNKNATADNITNSVKMFVDDTDVSGDKPPATETETYGFILEKHDGTTETILPDAEFVLYRTRTGEGTDTSPYVYSDPVKFTEDDPAASGYDHSYKVDPNGNEKIIAGKTKIWGLKAGTYYLVETKAPLGYNPLIGATEVKVGKDETNTENVLTAPISIANNKGSELPSTGGIGTTIFYVVGSLLMVGAAVLLIVRKKMSVMD